ncbi:MAG TPA: DNA-protecting protein DprA [Rhodospirillaceae bacterium]|nr:MAG: DNA protecting protein DprA [Alphaproteobacteria bacterium GWF2_58_20]HAU28797.1 DNA-protecting protein DprA [Rhodospirillaceae bacterium]
MTMPLPRDEKVQWIRLFRTENVGPVTFAWLISTYKTASAAIDALPQLSRRGGRSRPLNAISRAAAERELEWAEKRGIRIIASCEPDYPVLLSHISDAPPLLAIMGNPGLLGQPCISIVGSRNASLAGNRLAQQFAREIGAAGCTVVSGLARGIDTAAHKGALASGTAAVMAGGIDVVYPPENRPLYEEIREHGVIVSECAPETQPTAHHFPRRNRIVSGLSLGTLVVEASARSGSLITARLAAEQGREVFAIPGSPLEPRSFGPNQLIRDGAAMATTSADILDFIRNTHTRLGERQGNLFDSPSSPPPGDSEMDATRTLLLEKLGTTPVSIDETIRECDVSCATLMALLAELEIAGRIARLPGNRICLVPEEP